MRILHVNKFFDLHGGAEIYLHRLMRAQRDHGHEVHVFSTLHPGNQPTADAKRFVWRASLDKREGARLDARKAMQYLWNRDARRAMEQTIRECKPDVVHLHNIYHHLSTSVLEPIRTHRLPCVQTLHDYKVVGCANYKMYTEGAPCERCKGGAYWQAVVHACAAPGVMPNVLAMMEMSFVKMRGAYERAVQTFLCPSQFLLQKMSEWGARTAQLRYLPNPVALPDAERAEDRDYLLYAGRLSPEKGLQTLFEAMTRVPDISLVIAGRGPEEERLRAWVRLHPSVRASFVGFQNPSSLARLRQYASAEVLPSVWYENAPLSILEAMAMGLPCLVSRIGGLPELVEDGVNGLLATPQNRDSWVQMLRQFVLLSASNRRRMGDAGRARVEQRHTWKQHLMTLESIYERI